MRRAIAFLTPLPAGHDLAPTARTFDWFPVVGALLGLSLGGLWWGAEQIWPPAVAAAVVVTADLALTGMLHFDGLADSADGLLPHLADRDRRLAVMAEPDIGAFGVGVGAAALLLRFTALASMPPEPLLLAGLWCGSRTVMAAAARALPYARTGGAAPGLASSFLGTGHWAPVGALGLAASLTLGALAGGGPAAAAGAAVFAAGALVVGLAHRRLGGFTGDVLGAAGLVGETAGLLVAAARG
jgi:adenosylcobinamide-GDP ribazoletransferase